MHLLNSDLFPNLIIHDLIWNPFQKETHSNDFERRSMVNPTLFMLIISLVVSIAAAVGNIIQESARSCHLLWFVFFSVVSGAAAAAAFARLLGLRCFFLFPILIRDCFHLEVGVICMHVKFVCIKFYSISQEVFFDC